MALWNKRDLFRLFAVCALPVHAWAVVQMLKQAPDTFDWTGLWNALGLAAYTLTFALFESVVLAGVVFLVSQLLPKRWEAGERLGQVCLVFLLLSLWAVLRRVLMINEMPLTERPVVWLVLLFLLSHILPVLLLHRLPRFQSLLLGFIDRLAVLAALYLVLDVAGVALVVFRNLWGPL